MADPLLVEREREKIFIEAALAATAAGQSDRYQAIFITGPAQRGGAALLTVASEMAGEAFTRLGQPYQWPAALDNPESLRPLLPPAAFSGYDTLRQRLAEIENRVEMAQLALGWPQPGQAANEERYRAVQAIPPAALHFLIRRLYTIYVPKQMSEQAAAFVKTGLEHLITLNATNLSQLRAFVEEVQTSLSPADWQLYLRPEEETARRLGQELASLSQTQPLLITISDYAGANDRWLRLVIEESGRTLWLFSAAQRPGWQTDWLAELPLAPLSATAVAAYFKDSQGRELSQEELNWLMTLSGGEPLTVAIASALLGGGCPVAELDAARSRTPNDPLDGLFLYFTEESPLLGEAERQALYTTALLRQPDATFLERFAPLADAAGYPYDPAGWTELVSKYGWLEQAGGLHPLLRRYLLSYLLVERRRFSRPVQEGIIEPARTVAVQLLNERETALVDDTESKGSLPARARDAEWCARVGDLAYYRLWLDEAVGWFFLLPRFLMALAYNPAQARRWLAQAEELAGSFYVEGREIMPRLQTLLTPSYSGGRAGLDQKFAALEGLEELGTSARGRWYRVENLGLRPESGGSPEAELRGLLKWFQASLLEEAGQYERAASLYESVLATNVAMPDLQKATARSALYLATRFRLKGADESAYSALSRASELDSSLPQVWLALFYQSLRTHYYNTALKAADALAKQDGYATLADLFTLVALAALERWPEANTELRSYLMRPVEERRQARATFQTLWELTALPSDTPQLAEILYQLPE